MSNAHMLASAAVAQEGEERVVRQKLHSFRDLVSSYNNSAAIAKSTPVQENV